MVAAPHETRVKTQLEEARERAQAQSPGATVSVSVSAERSGLRPDKHGEDAFVAAMREPGKKNGAPRIDLHVTRGGSAGYNWLLDGTTFEENMDQLAEVMDELPGNVPELEEEALNQGERR